MIRIENLTQPYGLTNITCQISEGKLIGIMGANGAGKSTLLKTLAGILPVAGGEIWFNDDKLSTMSAEQKSRQLAYLAQNTEIHWDLSVYDVIALGLPNPLNRAKEQAKVRSISDTFSVSHLLEKPFRQLSGGEKARVQLARCCIKGAPLLLADEPIAPLDPYYQIDIMEQLKSLTPEHTVVAAIHHLSLAYKFCDEVILLDKGNIIASGNTQVVLNAENLAKAFGVRAEFDQKKKSIANVSKFKGVNPFLFTPNHPRFKRAKMNALGDNFMIDGYFSIEFIFFVYFINSISYNLENEIIGSKYPIFAKLFIFDGVISGSDLFLLEKELEEIKKELKKLSHSDLIIDLKSPCKNKLTNPNIHNLYEYFIIVGVVPEIEEGIRNLYEDIDNINDIEIMIEVV